MKLPFWRTNGTSNVAFFGDDGAAGLRLLLQSVLQSDRMSSMTLSSSPFPSRLNLSFS